MNWQPFHLAGTPALAAATPGFTQETGAGIDLESSLGVSFFAKELSFAASPTLGSGTRYHLNCFILANFAFSHTPTHPSEVIYQFAKLHPVLDYKIRAEFFNKVGAYLKQKIAVHGFGVKPDIEVPAGRNEVDWLTLPRESFEKDHVWIRQRQ